jgi:hypothetical protein
VFIQRNAFQGQHFPMTKKGWAKRFDEPIVPVTARAATDRCARIAFPCYLLDDRPFAEC